MGGKKETSGSNRKGEKKGVERTGSPLGPYRILKKGRGLNFVDIRKEEYEKKDAKWVKKTSAYRA